jgi:hypothetical protein
MTLMRTNISIVALTMITLFFAGCATEPSRVEMDYGTSYKLAIHNQTLNPDAEKNIDPVYGIEGQIAKKNVDKYQKSFERPLPASNTYIMTVPGVQSGGGQ